jgi:hypothetical protein
VRTVVAVLDPASGDAVDYVLSRTGWLDLRRGENGRRCTAWPSEIDITYEYGSSPPAQIDRAIELLAKEFELADADDVNCRLPSRVTNVNRQGVSWTLIDPMDFLDKGRTGIVEIDLLLSAYGTPKAKARVSSPEYPMPFRLETTQLPTPEPAP